MDEAIEEGLWVELRGRAMGGARLWVELRGGAMGGAKRRGYGWS